MAKLKQQPDSLFVSSPEIGAYLMKRPDFSIKPSASLLLRQEHGEKFGLNFLEFPQNFRIREKFYKQEFLTVSRDRKQNFKMEKRMRTVYHYFLLQEWDYKNSK